VPLQPDQPVPTSTIPHIFYRPDALPAAQPTASKHMMSLLTVRNLLNAADFRVSSDHNSRPVFIYNCQLPDCYLAGSDVRFNELYLASQKQIATCNSIYLINLQWCQTSNFSHNQVPAHLRWHMLKRSLVPLLLCKDDVSSIIITIIITGLCYQQCVVAHIAENIQSGQLSAKLTASVTVRMWNLRSSITALC